MNDCELLELAAKAAGLDANLELNGTYSLWSEEFDCIQSVWNPLTDDGDALRLAVKLNLTVYNFPDEACVWTGQRMVTEDLTRCGDLYTASRRAIVRAAAEVGKGMK